jgi:hypothetical protein
MTYREKMIHNLDMAEAMTKEIEKMEAAVQVHAETEHIMLYQMAHALQDNLVYRNRVQRRDLYLGLARTYALAELAISSPRLFP